MDYSYELLKTYIQIYNELCDEESKLLYRAVLMWRLLGVEEFYKSVEAHDSNRDYGWNELMNFEYFNNPNYRGIVLFGSGRNGMEFYYQLKTLGYKVLAFCDNDKKKIGKTYLDCPIISSEQLCREYHDAFVIITPSKYKEQIKTQLNEMGFGKNNICIPITGFACIYNIDKNQYYDDVIIPKDNEIFIDAGAYDGATVINFAKWCNNNYKKIYAFEPSPEIADICRRNICENGLNNVEIIQAGLYNEDGELKFDNSFNTSGAATISEQGNNTVQVVSLDNILKDWDDGVTFIKMDIEGAELSALQGAKETIIKYKPRLAICVYHKTEDIIVIPAYIKSLRPDYKFYIRKYTPHHGEIVLYCV